MAVPLEALAFCLKEETNFMEVGIRRLLVEVCGHPRGHAIIHFHDDHDACGTLTMTREPSSGSCDRSWPQGEQSFVTETELSKCGGEVG